MALYFLHLRDGTDEILDPDGSECATLESLKSHVLTCARELLSHDIKSGTLNLKFRIDAEDDGQAIIYTLPFKDAFRIIPE